MRLNCNVERRDRQLASLSLKGKRGGISVLSIGQKAKGGDVFIMHHALTTKENTYYQVRGNILKVFTKFLNEGKATISFAAPPHDLMIKVEDIIQLKSFLGSMRSVLQGMELSTGVGGLSNLDSSIKANRPKTKLVVDSKSNYPVLEGFSRTLLQLHITGIELKNFDSRILKLHHLQDLNLKDNKLKILPRGLGDLPNLSELCLAHNDLGSSARQPGAWDWLRGSQLPTRLRKLNLVSNGIPALPSFLSDCSGIYSLALDDNQLTVLPSGLGKMQSLRFLSAANNKLEFLPGSMLNKNLDLLDVSKNPFNGQCITTAHGPMKPLTLKELAARCVIFEKIPVTEAIIPYTVLKFMQGCDFCLCGKACFNPAYSRIIYHDTRKLAACVTFGSMETSAKPFRLCICSDRCYQTRKL